MTSNDVIAPVRKIRHVQLDPVAAFDLFTNRMGEWWPLASHSISGSTAALVRFEGEVGGRVVEVAPDGTEYSWADILVFDPPERFVVSWHPNPEPVAASTLELRFVPDGDGCRVELEHRGWEAFGFEGGRDLRSNYEVGWDVVLSPFERAATSAT